MSSAGDRTEKATPKRREEARKEGQVARSMEVNTAFAMLFGFLVLLLWGPKMWSMMVTEMTVRLAELEYHDVSAQTVSSMSIQLVKSIGILIAPIFGALALVGVVANVVQVKFKITPQVVKPRLSRVNPINGFKQRFSPAALVELAKNVGKLIAVGTPAMMILWANRHEITILGQVEPSVALAMVASLAVKIGLVVAGIYVFIAIGDYIWQRHRYEKQLRMTKHEVKQEQRQQDMSPEMKSQQRRRQRDMARRRMLADVPDADVIITNPTHYSVALKYDSEMGAPQVLAKGVDLLALRIREIGDEHDITRVENAPLARELYARVDVGQMIPADMYAAVAEVLAFVYRAEGKARDKVAG